MRILQRKTSDKNQTLSQQIMRFLKFESETFTVMIDDDVMNETQLSSITSCTAGFSCREITKLIVGIQSCLYSSDIPHLSATMVEKVVDSKVIDHQNKMRMSELSPSTTRTDDVDLSFTSMENSEGLSSQSNHIVDESLNNSLIRRAMSVNIEELNILATP